ncbi:hypothetical protein [Desulfofustis limnaeus]|uniref:Transposase n=1 Tax=Desulfofustis limnaeus TaxID=2740163 RepID=A0ABM7WA74_9BACT|nr:hypothetical protein [Desulfofustis limnaeus]BDD87854.1 hypothetical protein DPPLL_22190 [Desulfofustis limnaeus]
MFLDQELKNIREAKNRVSICCDLHRRLVDIEIREMYRGTRRTISTLTLGLAVAEQILRFLREEKFRRR